MARDTDNPRTDERGGNARDTLEELGATTNKDLNGHPDWWLSLSAQQREIHYNRNRTAEQPEYVYPGVAGDKHDDRLRESYSFDPYAHTAQMIPHQPPDCDCQMCLLQIGIARC